MPNWAEGTLKIRGTRENIKKFLTEALSPIFSAGDSIRSLLGQEVEQPKSEIKEDEWKFEMKSPNGFHIAGTRRAFIESGIDWWFDDKHEEILVIDSFKQAWGVDPEPFAKLSKQYDIDFKIYVFERGMEFNQEVEIHSGEIITNKEIQFKDYEWECIFPNLGG